MLKWIAIIALSLSSCSHSDQIRNLEHRLTVLEVKGGAQ